ncbi:MAG: hypothetical protein AAGC67_14090 [Myxococcota bacterium]
MIPLLGMACVAWTAFEIARLVQRTGRPSLAAEGPPAEARPPRRRRRHFAAWDERGRPIDVEDLGQA